MTEVIGSFGTTKVKRSEIHSPELRKEYEALRNGVFSQVLQSLVVDSAEEAWADYRKVEAQFFEFVRGYKYWRRKPELQNNKDFDAGTVEYRVRARIFSVMEELPGVPQAKTGDM